MGHLMKVNASKLQEGSFPRYLNRCTRSKNFVISEHTHMLMIGNYDIGKLCRFLDDAQHIVILGSPGSGKTTLAKKIASVCRHKCKSMDDLYWLPGWKRPEIGDFHVKVMMFLAQEGPWILDGMYLNHLFLERVEKADAVIVIAQPLVIRTVLFMIRVLREWVVARKHPRKIRPRLFNESYRILTEKIIPFARNDLGYIISVCETYDKNIYLIK